MSKVKFYNQVKELYVKLGLSPVILKPLYRTKKKEFWQKKVRELKVRVRNERIKDELLSKVKKRQFQLDLKRGNFQEIFNRLVFENRILSSRQANSLFNTIRNSGELYNLKISFNKKTQLLPININTKDFIIDILKSGLIQQEETTYGSDTLDNIDFSQIDSITIYKLPKAKLPNRDGRFFPYINDSILDLSKYQIFNQEQAYAIKNREHCLIHSLLQCGIDENLINEVKLSFKTGTSIKKSDLKIISNIIKKFIVLHFWDDKAKKIRKYNYGDKDLDSIKIAIHENHYFTFEETIYSKFFIKNYHKCCNLRTPEDIVKLDKGKCPIYSKNSKINSLDMVVKLLNCKLFKKLDMSVFEESASHQDVREHIYLDNIDNEQELMKVGKTGVNISSIFYADCESFVHNKDTVHELYILGCVGVKSDNVLIYNVLTPRFKGSIQELVYSWFKDITNNSKSNAIVYFHNLKYDYHLLEPYLNIRSKCEKDGNLYNVVISYNKATIELRDSYKLLPFALSKFNKEFDLGYSKKEAINYTYYTKENHNQLVGIEEYSKGLSNAEKKIFYENVKNDETYDSYRKRFNPLNYYEEYLILDCLVLKKGLEQFNATIGRITGGMSIYDYLTISSLTDKFMVKEGAYDGIYQVKGNLRSYISKAVYGGRVCVNEKYKKKIIEGKISDYDGVSLYPSAINRLCREIGLPKGKATRYKKDELNGWKSKLYSILTVKITKVNKVQQMPFIAYKSEDDILDYTNTPPKENIIIDSITLEDYINFHKIEYDLLDGIYWNEGSNPKMGEIIQRLFKARLQAKKDKKTALSNTIKLMLNSSYGKTIMKKSKTKYSIIKNKFICNKEKQDWIIVNNDTSSAGSACQTDRRSLSTVSKYISNNFNTIKSWRQLSENIFEVQNICFDNSFNRGHVGCAILSMSKRIMNEVFDVANDNNYPIYYTDTDSLHCNLEDVPKLEHKYKERYNKELNGIQLEQFHTDFNLNGAVSEIYATKSIFLGKKSYIDLLESKNENGNIIKGQHIRLKGITEEGLEDIAKKYTNSYEGLYTDLANGNEIEITLNPYNEEEQKQKVLFEYIDGKVRTRKTFTRKVKF